MARSQLVTCRFRSRVRAITSLVVLGAIVVSDLPDISVAKAHSVPTHLAITTAAVQYLRLLAVNRVAGVDPRFACDNKLEHSLNIGARQEDDAWLTRPFFHFDPQLTFVDATCNSTDWGLGAGNCRSIAGSYTNSKRWEDAVAAASSADLETGNYSGWIELGYVLHLLQDLTSPAHVRNDAHPPGFDSDPLEAVNRVPDISSLPMSPLISVTTPEALFASLRDFVQSRHFSADTVFQSPGRPYDEDISQDLSYYYSLLGERVAYKGRRWWLSYVNNGAIAIPSDATIDSDIADNQFESLGPRAVRYTASLIAHYLAEAEQATGAELLPPCEVLGQYVGTVAFSSFFTAFDGTCREKRNNYATSLGFVPSGNFGFWRLDLIGTATYYNCDGTYLLGPFSEHRVDFPRAIPAQSAGATSFMLDSCYFGTVPTTRCWSVWTKFTVGQFDATGTWDFDGQYFGDFPGSYDEFANMRLSKVRHTNR
jgi:hypothetical protein